MNKILSLAGAAACAVLMFSGSAEATSFSLSAGGTNTALPSNYNPTNNGGVSGVPVVGTIVTVFDSSSPAGAGLLISQASDLLFTYVGKEAGDTNAANNSLSLASASMFTTATDNGGETFSGSTTSPLVQLLFKDLSSVTSAINGGPIASTMAIAFFIPVAGGNVAFALLDDGGAGPDKDFDDMVIKITAVPLPGALPLFGAGLGLLGLLGRRRKKPMTAVLA